MNKLIEYKGFYIERTDATTIKREYKFNRYVDVVRNVYKINGNFMGVITSLKEAKSLILSKIEDGI